MASFKKRAYDVADSTEFPTRQAEESFKRALRIWRDRYDSYDVEHFYVAADLSRRLAKDSNEQSLADDASYMIAKTLEQTMGRRTFQTHVEFLDKTPGPKTFITLNWDIALDNSAYGYMNSMAWYGYEPAEALNPERFPVDDGVLGIARHEILKLHGSFNWWFCPRDKKLLYKIAEKDILRHWESGPTFCPHCQTELVPGMVPPTSQKFEEGHLSPLLGSIWGRAREVLGGCETLYLCGYSFPITDLQVMALVQEAVAVNARLRAIVIVSPPKRGTRGIQFDDRMEQIFESRREDCDLRFLDLTFEEWVHRGCLDRRVTGDVAHGRWTPSA